MKVSAFAPIKNEALFVGYSIMSILPNIHEILYAVSPSDDGTWGLLNHIKDKYAGDKLKLFEYEDFDVRDRKTYEKAYNFLLDKSSGQACWYFHADMVCVNSEKLIDLKPGPLAWWAQIRSYAGDLETEILKGRAKRWKNIHAKEFGLHYAGAYGSQNEDMYFRDITGSSYRHYDEAFERYPFEVAHSGLIVNHYCEAKTYKRRFEKMKICLREQNPMAEEAWIEDMASRHPRVTLESTTDRFGVYEFSESEHPIPDVFEKYKEEFEAFQNKKELVHV